MKKTYLALALIYLLFACKTTSNLTATTNTIKVNIDLVNIKDDKVFVSVQAPTITTETVTYSLPKMVPGTYSEDNFGAFIESLKAYDKNGKSLTVKKTDTNSWSIANAKKLDRITYLVNDTFDTEKGGEFGTEDIFSPSGSNIEASKNIVLNTHCFIGYFENYMSTPYSVSISHPETLWGATSMIDYDNSTSKDLFEMPKYSELVENPIMYSKPDYTTFKVDDMEILIAVYSPTGKFSAESITPTMKKMMTAQKDFLGPINSTKKYSVLLYLSTTKNDAMGNGALEHPTATTVVFPESISEEKLLLYMKDVVSHEFFHIVTPLTIHSQEIQNFDYNKPKMSEHLWMYEGVTEYFANLFQINQGLINEEEFYNRIIDQINQAKKMNDTMPFTTMSRNVLKSPYKEQYLNVYQKGALIGMCIDIIIRENSQGKRGILDLMHKLSNEYGVSKAFKDEALFAEITALTYPEVGQFLKNHVSGSNPIPYDSYLQKVGLSKVKISKPLNIFEKNEQQYVALNAEGEIMINSSMKLNVFFTHLGLKTNDIILAVNDKEYTADLVNEILVDCENWKENDPITIKIRRNGKEQTIKGMVQLPFEEQETYKATDSSKEKLKEAWLKG